MASKIDYKFDDGEIYIKKLKEQLSHSREFIPECIKGEMLDEYLKSCDYAEEHIDEIEKKLQELHQCIKVLELQSLV